MVTFKILSIVSRMTVVELDCLASRVHRHWGAPISFKVMFDDMRQDVELHSVFFA